ncbi:MAG TPA: MarR family transcriptional regulator [Candidatus Binatia bacterium]|nr:MarR family transcriptional regulator [Candidatus Binatia bacterium]
MTTNATGRRQADEIVEALAPLLAQQRERWAARCQEHGLSIIGFHVLALLEMHGGVAMSRLAEELDVALPNATGIVGRMADRGLVERTHDEADRRVVRVSLTDASRRLIDEMEAGRRDRMKRLVRTLDERQQRRLLHAVHDLRAAADRLGTPGKDPG